jgi:Protein of unknown function (DUF4238)
MATIEESLLQVSMYGERRPVQTGEHYPGCSCGRFPGGARREGEQVRHHTTPRMFLRGFADDNRVNRRGEDGSTQRRLSIDNVFVRRRFYALPADDLPSDLLVENMLGAIEDFVTPPLARLRRGDVICDTDKQWLASFFGLLRSRTVSMRGVILRTLTERLREAGHSIAPLDDDLAAVIELEDGSIEDVRRGVLLAMVEWGVGGYGRRLHEFEWALQRVPPHRIVLSREPVTHLNEDGAEFLLVPLDHQTVLYMYPRGRPPRFALTSGAINWIATRFADEFVWHPETSEPQIRPPWWWSLVRLEPGRLPDAA